MTFRTNQPGSALATQVSLHFWSRACKIEQWILEEFNFEGHDSFFFFCAGIWVVFLPLSIDTLDADSSGGPGFCLYQASPYLLTLPYHAYPITYFSGFDGPVKKKWGSFSKKTKGSGSPHPHSHSMEEQLLNPHYNQSKYYPDLYMMLNWDRDRERRLPLGSSRQKLS